MEALATRGVELARTRGAQTSLLTLLRYQALVEQSFGRFAAADAAIGEAQAIAVATGNAGVFGSGQVIEFAVAARRGPEARARLVAAEATRAGIQRGQLGALGHIKAGMTVLEISLGRYRAALEPGRDLFQADPFWAGNVVLPDLVEAASRAGAPELAAAALQRLTTRARASASQLALGLLARAQALLAGDGDAEHLYLEAIERLATSKAIIELARSNLLYGEWLRRRRRRRDAREQLHSAHRLFTAIDAEHFAARAGVELLATGEQVRTRTPGTLELLTAQQAQVAHLVSEGASNSEVAARLYISSATVAYHLRNAFRKLGVTSRTGLAVALRELGEATGPSPPPSAPPRRPGA